MIAVTRKSGSDALVFEVVVSEDGTESRHQVTMTRATYTRLTQGRYDPETCIEAAFRFLLDREPMEAILRRFDADVISEYFPEFEKELPKYFARR